MDNEQTIDSFVDALYSDVPAEADSHPEAGTPEEVVPDAVQAVAPTEAESPEVSSTDVVQDAGVVKTPVETPPAPDPALLARLEAAEKMAQESRDRADGYERMVKEAQQRHLQQQYEQARQAQDAEFQTRAIQIENITDPEMQKREAARLVADVQQARNAEAQVAMQQRDQQIANMERSNEQTAAIAAGFYQTIQSRTDLTDDQKKEILSDTKYYAQYPSPQAQSAAIERDKNLVSTAVARAKAEWEKAQGQAIEARNKERVASDTDLVGSSSGSAGGRPASIDDFVDSVFR